jgi:hypothetical protein
MALLNIVSCSLWRFSFVSIDGSTYLTVCDNRPQGFLILDFPFTQSFKRSLRSVFQLGMFFNTIKYLLLLLKLLANLKSEDRVKKDNTAHNTF